MVRGEKTLHPECTNFAPRMHQLCTKNAPTLHQECTNVAPKMHQLCTKNAPTLHPECTKNAPTLHQEFANFAPRIRQLCTKNAPTLHQHCPTWKQQSMKRQRKTRGKTDTTEGPKITKFSKSSIYFRSNLLNLVNGKSMGFSK